MSLGFATNASAQSAVDGPNGRFDDDLISNLEGQWCIGRQIRGTTVYNTARATCVLNHQFLQLHMKDEATPPQYEALVHIGYVYSDQQYIAFWTGTFGAKFAGVGRGTRTGNSVEFRFGQPEVTFFNTFTWVPERQEWVLRMETPNASGGRSLFAIDTFSARFGRIMEPDGNRVELRQPPEGQWSSVAKTAIQPIAEPGARPSLQSITEFKT